MEFTNVKNTNFMCRHLNNLTVSRTELCKFSPYSRIIKFLCRKKRIGSPYFLFSNNIANPSSNSPNINITANILTFKNVSDKRGTVLACGKISIQNVKT